MARMFLAPTATCSLVGSSAADVKGYVWLSVAAASDGSACCAFYAGASAAMDSHIWTLTATSGHLLMAAMIGPFKVNTSTVYADLTGTRASALIATASY
jgi:hypothetical protein